MNRTRSTPDLDRIPVQFHPILQGASAVLLTWTMQARKPGISVYSGVFGHFGLI